MKLLIIFLVVVAGFGCSQRKIEHVSYKSGEAAAAVVETAEKAYDATVDASSSAYENLKQGYKERRIQADTEFEEHEYEEY